MKCYEFSVASTMSRSNDGPFVDDGILTYAFPEEAMDLLEPILGKYGQDPMWYFDKLNYGRPPAPWAIVCMDQEYKIAGHIATTRTVNSGIAFAPYTQPPRSNTG